MNNIKNQGLVATIIKSKINGNYSYCLSFKRDMIKFIDDNQYTHIEYVVNNNQLSCVFIKNNEVGCTNNVQMKITKSQSKKSEMSNYSYNYTCVLPIEQYILLMKIGYNIDSIQFKPRQFDKVLSNVNKEVCFRYNNQYHYETETKVKTVITNSNAYSLITKYKLI